MARRRTHNSKGQFIADDPSTKEVNEAWETPPVGGSTDTVATVHEETKVEPKVETKVEAHEEAGKQPVEIELKYGSNQDSAPQPVSREKIEASVKEKLSRKTDSPASNPFVPHTQLENEVKEVAKNQGFQLSRGTEIGARLIARSHRKDL